MLRRVTGATNRTLTHVGLAALAVILAVQAVIFALWGDEGDPPDAVVSSRSYSSGEPFSSG